MTPVVRGEAALLTTLVVGWTASALLDPSIGSMDPEEGVTAAHAVALAWSGPTDVARFQYMPVCSGCTAQALLAAPAFALAGPAAWVWKLTLLPWMALLSGAAIGGVGARWGRPWAWLTALVLALPPSLAARLALRGWSNHHEAAAVGLAALCLAWGATSARGRGAAGFLAVVAVLVGRSAAPLALAAAGLGLRGEGRRAFTVGAGLGLVPWTIVLALEGPAALDVVTQARLLNRGLGLAEEARELVAPQRVAAVLGGAAWGRERVEAAAVLVGVGLAAGGALRGTGGLGPALFGAVVVGVLGLWLGPAEAGGLVGPQEFNARYLVGVSWAATLLLVAGARGAWSRGRRVLAVLPLVLVLPWTARGAVALRARPDPGPVLHARAPDWTMFRRQVLPRDPRPDVPLACGDDPTCRVVEAYRRGLHRGAGPGGDAEAYAAGAAAAVARAATDAETRATLDRAARGEAAPDLPEAAWAEQVSVSAAYADPPLPCPAPDAPPAVALYGWAVGVTSVPRFGGALPDPPCSHPAFRHGWGRGAGQGVALQAGPAWRPPGFEAWPEDARRGFLLGVADSAASPLAAWPAAELDAVGARTAIR